MHINEKIKATTICIAAAIYPPFDREDPEFPSYPERGETLRRAVDKLELSDEQKANLYDSLEEDLTPTTKYGDALYLIERAVYYCYMPEEY